MSFINAATTNGHSIGLYNEARNISIDFLTLHKEEEMLRRICRMTDAAGKTTTNPWDQADVTGSAKLAARMAGYGEWAEYCPLPKPAKKKEAK